MALVAQFASAWDGSGRAQFVSAWAEDSAPLVVITDVDAGNVDPNKVIITDAAGSEPTVFVDSRSATGPWRHMLWAVENAEGKRPRFELNRNTRVTYSAPGAGWGLLWTQDFVNWTKSPPPTLVSGSPNKIVCQFAVPLPAGRIFFATQPMVPEGHSGVLAAHLLSAYPGVASPTPSANAEGVYNVSPAETDDLGRQVGGRNQYAIKLSWPTPTTDGGRKRVMVMMSGIHVAGEGNASIAHRAALEWMLEDAGAEAAAFRANWDVYTYFNISPNGYYGGHSRNNFRSSSDPNRTWDSSSLAEIAATKAAITNDLNLGSGGNWDAMYAWHAYYVTSGDFQCWVTPGNANPATRSPIMQAMFDAGAGIFESAPVLDHSGTLNTDVWWADASGARVSFDTELAQNGNTSPQFFKDVGVKWMRTLAAVDAAGWFDTTSAELSASAGLTAGGSATLSASLALSAVGLVVSGGDAPIRVAVPLSAIGYALAGGNAVLEGSAAGDLQAIGGAQAGGSADLVANVTISAEGLMQAAGAAGLTVAVLQAAAGGAQAGGDVVLSLEVQLAASGGMLAGGVGVLDAGESGSISATGGAQTGGSAAITAMVPLTAAGILQAFAAGYLVAQVDLSAVGGAAPGGAAVLSDAAALVLIESRRWVVEAAGRRWVVTA